MDGWTDEWTGGYEEIYTSDLNGRRNYFIVTVPAAAEIQLSSTAQGILV